MKDYSCKAHMFAEGIIDLNVFLCFFLECFAAKTIVSVGLFKKKAYLFLFK